MKLLTPLLVLLFGLSAFAQYGDLDDARQAERDARNAAIYGPGYLTPGDVLNPYRPVRPLPPPPPQYGRDRGPRYTVRWQDYGLNRVPKLVSETITIRVGGMLVNEILFRAVDNKVQVDSAVAYLSNGQTIDLGQMTGTIREGRDARGSLDYYFSLRVERIVISATSANLIGSRGQLQVMLGLAQ
jgi:hypothetical protein